MRFPGLNLLRHWHHRHHHAHPFHPFHHHAFRHHPHHGTERHGERARDHALHGDRLGAWLDGLGERLDLDSHQLALLGELQARLREQRHALRAGFGGLDDLIASENFDRAGAQQHLDARLDALRTAGPGLIAALAEFFDSLDFEQQQALRFVMRLRRGPHARGRHRQHGWHERHNGRHDAPTAAD